MSKLITNWQWWGTILLTTVLLILEIASYSISTIRLIALAILFLLIIFLITGNRQRERELNELIEVLALAQCGNLNARVFTQSKGRQAELALSINQLIENMQELDVSKRRWEKSRKRLLTNISHDIRTPLTSIIGYVDALIDQVVSSEEERIEYLKIIAAKSQSLTCLIEDIFHLAKLDANEVVMQFDKHDLNELLRSSVINFLPEIKKWDVSLEVDISDDPYWIYADYNSILRVVYNIMKNALQHGRTGKVIGVKVSQQGKEYQVEIWDRGSGIPEYDLTHVFDRLFKGDDSRKKAGDSSGLGLSIAKELLLNHHGEISVTSIPHQRTSFFVTLPTYEQGLTKLN